MANDWIAFSYTLSAKKKSSTRVAIWRRLQRLGVVSPVGGIHLLPASDDCVESFQWLAQEVNQAGGQAVLMYVDSFEGLPYTAIVEQFQSARKAEYAEVDEQTLSIEAEISSEPSIEFLSKAQDELVKLKRRYAEIVSIDYFNSYEQTTTAARLDKVAQMLFPETSPTPDIPLENAANYQSRTWVTRPQPHVDRLSSIWLIRRFIDEEATIRYGKEVGPDEIGFDMNADLVDDCDSFGHNGNLCTFETLIRAFQIEAPGISAIAEIVHQIDLHDERFVHPEAIGIDAILRGWLLEDLTDQQLEERGLALFDGIYQFLSNRTQATDLT